MSFFVRKQRGGKTSNKAITGKKRSLGLADSRLKKSKKLDNEEISSGSELDDFSDDDGNRQFDGDKLDLSEDELETAQEKRFRIAKTYLADIEKQEQEKSESAEIDKELLGQRLKEDLLEQAGKLHRKVATQLTETQAEPTKWTRLFKGHKGSLTCVAISSDGKHIVSCDKNGTIIKWSIDSNKPVHVRPGLSKKLQSEREGHHRKILAVTLSSDDKYLCTGGADMKIHVWDFEKMKTIQTFDGHRDWITSLTFRKGTHQLFSGSKDKSVKVWSLDDMGYVDTMFGHQDDIQWMDALGKERFLTCGGTDRSIRMWKVAEESQLVFNGHSSCNAIDCVRLINEDHFVSGADDGSLSVWSVARKKPVCLHRHAHGSEEESSEEFWVSAVATLPYTDLIASGSRDGKVKLWECSLDYKSLKLLHAFPVKGFINDLAFTSDGDHLVCAVGQEHRRGRWWREKSGKNCLLVIPLLKKKDC